MSSKEFSELLEFCKASFNNDPTFIIGGGNPDSQILFIGQEPSDNAEDSNTLNHYLNANGEYDIWTRKREDDRKWHIDNPRFYKTKKGETKRITESNFWHRHTTLWYNYQLLYDYIIFGEKRDHRDTFDFEENVFCSEINGDFSKFHVQANLGTMQQRKEKYFTHQFFKKFKIIVLSCGSCIVNTPDNPQISRIFNVVPSNKENPETGASIRDNYWIHYDNITEPGKILIHTRNLSGSMKKDFVKDMGLRIHDLIKEKLKLEPLDLLVK